MQSTCLFTCLSFITIYFSATYAKCPEGSLEYLERAECIYPVDSKTTYPEAKKICRNLGGQIITIRDIFENVMSGSEAQTTLGVDSQSYIGVIRGSDGTWTNDDGTSLKYQNWKSGNPLQNVSCAVQSAQDYQWISVSCDTSTTFICSILNNGTMEITTTAFHPACPAGWVPFNGKCYYFQDPVLEDHFVSFTIYGAEDACQSMGATVVSIHSQEEFDFLKREIATDPSILKETDCQQDQAVIGLICAGFYQAWTDNTPFDFDKTKNCTAGTNTYGIINDPRCSQNDYWSNWDEDFFYYRYICKK
ncbi:unnamed protein product, partial [Mesorhabditis belari]|uniref:C-type lectin domain-containing protein n=1 Tax=Mesorhabditis belari TaxID=2138241 RepID=A0AAF3EP60_9BILA